MGHLITMTKPSYRVQRDAPSTGSAEILFFTGVRYARMPDTDAALASVTPRKRAAKPRRAAKTNDMKRA